MNPYFSIVIPALNEERNIGLLLEKVTKQSYKNFEVIVVDNNSTDSTATVVHEWIQRDSRIQLISCHIQGLLPARNKGYSIARGEIIVQFDADEIPSRFCLERAANHFHNKNIVALTGAYHFYDGPWWINFFSFIQYPFLWLGNIYVQYRGYGGFMLGGNAFIRKFVLDEIGGYDKDFGFMAEDLHTARAIVKYGKLAFCPNLTIGTSARRYKNKEGKYTLSRFFEVQAEYNVGTKAILKNQPLQSKEQYELVRD